MIQPTNEEGSTAPKTTSPNPKPRTSQTSAAGAQGAASSGRILDPDEECVINHAGESVTQIANACHLTRSRVLEILNEQELAIIEESTAHSIPVPETEPEIPPTPDAMTKQELCIVTEGEKGRTIQQIMATCHANYFKARKVLRDNHLPVKEEPEHS